MKQCKNCSTEFEPKHQTRGHEQVYCSIKCRTEAYKKRAMEKINNENNLRTTDVQREEHRAYPMGNIMPISNTDLIEKKFEAKLEAIEWKMKFDQVTKELEECKRKIFELESELEEIETDPKEKNTNGWLGAIQSNTEIGNAIGKLMQHDKVQNFVLTLIPETKN